MNRYAISSRVSCAIAIMVTVTVSYVVAGCSVEERAEPAGVSTAPVGARVAMRHSALGVPPSMREQSEALTVVGGKAMVESSLDAVRIVVKTATVECEVSDCDSAATQIERLVTRKRGSGEAEDLLRRVLREELASYGAKKKR